MGCDMVVALGQATVNGQKLFGLNLHSPQPDWPIPRRLPGQCHSAGTTLRTSSHELTQVRQTFTVLGVGPRTDWGFSHGLNERQVAMGVARWQSKIGAANPGLAGTDLVRLTLERSHAAGHAVEVLTDLITRHGQNRPGQPEGADHIFLIADGLQALVVEAAGSFWAAHECQQVRAVSDTAFIRQDWQRLAPGLADFAIAQGWWRSDGSKLDFGGNFAAPTPTHSWALKRWGRASLLLEQQNGHIDLWFLRRMLADHFEGVVRPSAPPRRRAGLSPAVTDEVTEAPPTLLTSFLTSLSLEPDAVPMGWCAFGPPDQAVYFPIFLDGELPALFQPDNIGRGRFLRQPAPLEKAQTRRNALDLWQAQIDQKTEDFLAQARALKKDGNLAQLQRQATLLMHEISAGVKGAHQPGEKKLTPALAEDLAYVSE